MTGLATSGSAMTGSAMTGFRHGQVAASPSSPAGPVLPFRPSPAPSPRKHEKFAGKYRVSGAWLGNAELDLAAARFQEGFYMIRGNGGSA